MMLLKTAIVKHNRSFQVDLSDDRGVDNTGMISGMMYICIYQC